MIDLIPGKYAARIKDLDPKLKLMSDKKNKFDDLVLTLNLMSNTKALHIQKEEFYFDFGENGQSCLRQRLKKLNVTYKLRIIESGTELIIFKNER